MMTQQGLGLATMSDDLSSLLRTRGWKKKTESHEVFSAVYGTHVTHACAHVCVCMHAWARAHTHTHTE